MESPKYIMINGYRHIPYDFNTYSEEEIIEESGSFYNWLDTRRSVREISDKPVPKKVIENLIRSASTAPSGGNKQPWTFCAISNQELKRQIRSEAEMEEKENYENRMSVKWKKDLQPFDTNMNKPFLEIAPWLIVVFKRAYDFGADGEKHPNYYVNESVGIACGMLLAAIHNARLVALTHTPSPMNFLTKILSRPENEKPFLLIPLGYPKLQTYVPDITRKGLDEVADFYE
jgi:nitroreductase